jgi:hypothetical protein
MVPWVIAIWYSLHTTRSMEKLLSTDAEVARLPRAQSATFLIVKFTGVY